MRQNAGMGKHWLEYVRRAVGRSPVTLARVAWRWTQAGVEQHLAPRRARRLTRERFLALFDASTVSALWETLAEQPFPGIVAPIAPAIVERCCPDAPAQIRETGTAALQRRVDILGSGPVPLSTPIDWHQDFKSGHRWPLAPSRRIDVNDLGRDSDVKVPWELSRLQWLIPMGQAYLMDGDEAYAREARAVIEEWGDANPVAFGVNWACAMDVALRAITLIWLFHAFHRAKTWRDEEFRFAFLRLLYIHGDFIARHLEWSDVNGNHLLADAAGLVFVGLFFERGRVAAKWQRIGWRLLRSEKCRQVLPDGADFEASTSYHRLVLELLLHPALYRKARGLTVDDEYRETLVRMAEFVAAYSRPDGSVPLWGDADDGRVLPFGRQSVNDHRYLVGLVGLAFDNQDLIAKATGPRDELFWRLGPEPLARLPEQPRAGESRAFPATGVYVMRSAHDHVFIDGGPIGMAGRGGHGHNDCLSFEAALDGVLLVVDSGCYVYTASVEWRNRFRATAAHNTPRVDGEEQNRWVRPKYLWTLRDDARPVVRQWMMGPEHDVFLGLHRGYQRLTTSVTPVRGIVLDKNEHRLIVVDRFEGHGPHRVSIPYHFAPHVAIEAAGENVRRLTANGREFLLVWRAAEPWQATVRGSWWSPSYGIKHPARALEFVREGALAALAVAILPASGAPDDASAWLGDQAARLLPPAGSLDL
jgi:uncharacterized heparinase superfamily protein